MKCYKHTADAIGVCSKCGKGLCPDCIITIKDKILCERCSGLYKDIEAAKLKQFKVISAVLGWFGAATTIFFGIYTSMALISLINWGLLIGRNFQMEAYLVAISTIISSIILFIGGYLMWKNLLRKGGTINLSAGTVVALIYSYYAISVVKPFGKMGLALCVPAILSGVFGLYSTKFVKQL